MLEPFSLEQLVQEFASFPGIGKKTARRLAYHLLQKPKQDIERFADRLKEVSIKVRPCSKCYLYTDTETCSVCCERVGAKSICVVEKPSDVLPFERSGIYQGLYFVLGGVLSPLDGVGPEKLHLTELVKRVQEENIEELILALGSSPEAESTMLLIDRLMSDLPVKCTRLARGIPMGSDLEFVDEITMLKAFEGRNML